MRQDSKPVIVLAIGDPAGIGVELAARMTADDEVRAAADLLVVGDARVLAMGARQAGIDLAAPAVRPDAPRLASGVGVAVLDLGHLDPEGLAVGQAAAAGGRFALANFRAALKLAQAGLADGAAFTPFNKQAMRLARPDFVDEIGFVTRELGAASEGSEFNVLEEVWNARVTSHMPLSEVARHITREAVLERILLTERCLGAAGKARPRIGVAALNPHAGDGGNFGHEDDEVIAPAVAEARARQIAATGPVPSDTVFVRALKGEFDAVLTMYHDQGQIAMKLIGFDRGVTLIGGYPFPITTPAHGTAYDIAGKGVTNPNATRQALLLNARMARRQADGRAFAPLAERLDRGLPFSLDEVLAEGRA